MYKSTPLRSGAQIFVSQPFISRLLGSEKYLYLHLFSKCRYAVPAENHPHIKPPVRFITKLVRTHLITSGDIPESPTTTPHGLWSYLSGKVFIKVF